MAERIGISVDTLEALSGALLKHLREMQGDLIQLERGYFWSIEGNERANVYAEPKSFTIGEISECWSSLEQMLADPTRQITFGLVWLGEILSSIGEEVVS